MNRSSFHLKMRGQGGPWYAPYYTLPRNMNKVTWLLRKNSRHRVSVVSRPPEETKSCHCWVLTLGWWSNSSYKYLRIYIVSSQNFSWLQTITVRKLSRELSKCKNDRDKITVLSMYMSNINSHPLSEEALLVSSSKVILTSLEEIKSAGCCTSVAIALYLVRMGCKPTIIYLQHKQIMRK